MKLGGSNLLKLITKQYKSAFTPTSLKLRRVKLALPAFTIVELLVVIVVIGILAAITIVSYQGVTSKAQLSSAMSAVSQAARKIDIYIINHGTFPSTLSDIGINNNSSVTYYYFQNTITQPAFYCIESLVGTARYKFVNDGSKLPGSCNLFFESAAPSPKLTDGDINTSNWVGLTSPITISLPNSVDVSAVKVWHYYGDGRTYYGTKTEVSEDNVNWFTTFDSAISGIYAETSVGRTDRFQSRKVRYIRDYLNGNTVNPYNHWVEVQAF